MNFHKYLKSYSTPFVMAVLVLSLYSCKTKKIAQTAPIPETTTVEKAKAEPVPETAIEKEEETAAVPEKINYDFKTIQFEFNSSVLKTFSYPVLDQIAKAIKKDPSVKFNVDGHSSAEGTVERNQTLSTDRANSVKSYLVSSGVSASNLIATGYGESKPITSNTTEAGKAQNRRVEISKVE
ncbi:MAG: OmpA/MotB domain protein [Sphingobacteriales bacterium]|nr:OmpA/MotB domain protein [Sphingobacteriales bacterium]